MLTAYDSNEQTNIFYIIWTLKEAYLKGTGEGITSSLKNIEFLGPFLQEQEFVKTCRIVNHSQEWFLSLINSFPDYIAAFATRNKPNFIKYNIIDILAS